MHYYIRISLVAWIVLIALVGCTSMSMNPPAVAHGPIASPADHTPLPTAISTPSPTPTQAATPTASPTAPPTQVPAASLSLPPVPGDPSLVIERVHTDKPYVAITVDDFFSVSNYQDREGVHLLEAANAAHAALTLCPTGYALEAYQTLVPDQLAQIKTLLAEGQYEICTHTLSHPVLPKLDRQGQAHEIGAGGKHIEHYLERPVSRLLRPPFGSWNDDTRYAAAAAGYPYIVTWSVDSGDWVGKEPPAVDTILANVACAQPGDIILMHANCQRSAEVLPLIIERLRANGLEPVTLSTLLASGQPMTTTNPKALEHGRFCPKGGK